MEPRDLIYNGGRIFRQSPVALATHQASGGTNDVVDVLFANFVAYAAVNWVYRTTSEATDLGLLNGTGANITACATIAGAFRILVTELFPRLLVSAVSLDSSSNSGHFLVKPGLRCFDRTSIGNIGNYGAKTASEFGVGTYFPNHYLAKVGNRYYDPCLMASYATADGPRWKDVKPLSLGRKNPGGMKKVGHGKDLIVLLPEMVPVPGFSSRYLILQPKQCKSILDRDGFETLKKDPDVSAGKFF